MLAGVIVKDYDQETGEQGCSHRFLLVHSHCIHHVAVCPPRTVWTTYRQYVVGQTLEKIYDGSCHLSKLTLYWQWEELDKMEIREGKKKNSDLGVSAGRSHSEDFVLYFTVRSNFHSCTKIRVQGAPGQGSAGTVAAARSIHTSWLLLLNGLKHPVKQGRCARIGLSQWRHCPSFMVLGSWPNQGGNDAKAEQSWFSGEKLHHNLWSNLYMVRKRIFHGDKRQGLGSHCETSHSFYLCLHLNEIGRPICSQQN